ncbi:response regulator [Leptospira sp. GIMC2001]|uniref:response regulator n=1 Tax=Leptospira sp. GIMC2001 TaxID=1513297 RepID=UPI00234A3919|nr:response regulator [Leptospira sp. GIMC2001]WCL48005.1 response regulator [Leptospira sp. GIMC2001]
MENEDTIEGSKKILVVEDETIIAINICNALQQFGYKTEYAISGEKALQSIPDFQPDLILMDIMLGSGMDGIETAEKIHQDSDTPIIYLTAYSDQNTLKRAKITDPFGYIIKPFHSRELYISIEMAIYKTQSLRAFRDMQDRLFESQKMESLGILSSAIAHEINNPLMSIMNFSLLGESKAKASSNHDLEHFFETIKNESDKISLVVKNLVNYAREDKDYFLTTSFVDLVVEAKSLFRQLLLRDGIEIVCNFEDNVPDIYCKVQKIKQVLINLISFSRISALQSENQDNKFINITIRKIQKRNEDYIEFVIRNSGTGLPIKEEKDKKKSSPLYENSYSLSNLGFYLSEGIIKEHGGIINSSPPGEESKILIELPVQQKKMA